MKLSVILCMYNTPPPFVAECLASIFESTLPAADYEVILVDDGSSVDYGEILKRHPVRYFRTENRGPLAARLYGAAQAEGNYLAFADSDDAVSRNYYLPMLECAEQSNADIVINAWAFRTQRVCRTCVEDSTMASDICAEGERPLELFTAQRGREHSWYVNWNKLYRRELVLKSAARLTALGIDRQRLSFAEDALFNFFSFKYAEKVVNVHSGFYFYRIHDDQISKEADSACLRRHIDAMATVFDCMLEHMGDHSRKEALTEDVNAWRALMARSHYQAALSLGDRELLPYLRERYHVERLEKPRPEDGAVYARGELLGENFSEIDGKLSEFYTHPPLRGVCYERSCRWVMRTLHSMERWNGVSLGWSREGTEVPKRRIPLRERLIHDPVLYRLGMMVFKKGSKTRGFLKKVL